MGAGDRLRPSPVYNETDRRGVFYAQSWLLVHYLLLGTENGNVEVQRYLDLARRLPTEEAMKQAFGRDSDALLKELRRYLNSKLFTYRRLELGRKKDEIPLSARELPVSEVQARLGELLVMHRNRPLTSEAYLRSALELNPEEPRAHLALGLQALYPTEGVSDYDAALNHFAAARAAAPEDPVLEYLVASTKASRGDPPRLVRPSGPKLVNARPQWGRVWELLAWAWTPVTDNPEQKIAVFTGALRFRPDNSSYAETLLDLYRETGRDEEVAALITNYFNPRGITLDVPILRSSTGSAEGIRLEEEMAAAREEAARSEQRHEERKRAAALAEEKRYEEALELYRRLSEKKPEDWFLKERVEELTRAVAHSRFMDGYNHAVKLFNERRWREAVEELEGLLEVITDEQHVAKAEKLLVQARTQRRHRGDSG